MSALWISFFELCSDNFLFFSLFQHFFVCVQAMRARSGAAQRPQAQVGRVETKRRSGESRLFPFTQPEQQLE